ncbi:tRNA pseudouridine(55) synthase TruB [Luedemannella flava]|uniref:tRNA pseudouridine synthase B n=1 Tax=Luedemannella flava TaxID=349316 RepID=A0ABP4XXG4_9ACTN
MTGREKTQPGGLIVVDKPAGMTSHDVVARVRRAARTRRVGHGGTLDPMATGVLVIGVERATRMLTYVIGSTKTYLGTVRLGQTTITDDAEGEVLTQASAAAVTDEAIRDALARFVGEIDQVPSAVSAIKIKGVRSYARVRGGEEVELAPRRITISHLSVGDIRPVDGGVCRDVDIEVSCSSGTYIRAIARDLGAALGVGGHLTALRRTAVGGFTLAEAVTIEDLFARAERDEPVVTLDLAAAARRCFPGREVDATAATTLGHGGPLPTAGIEGPYAVFGPGGEVVAIVSERGGRARPEVVLTPA